MCTFCYGARAFLWRLARARQYPQYPHRPPPPLKTEVSEADRAAMDKMPGLKEAIEVD